MGYIWAEHTPFSGRRAPLIFQRVENLEQLRIPIGRSTATTDRRGTVGAMDPKYRGPAPWPTGSGAPPLIEEMLDTPYRPGGWCVRQVVHHPCDSHHSASLRLKWALTQDNPVINAYDERAWAALCDSRTTPIQMSLAPIGAVHAKGVHLLQG